MQFKSKLIRFIFAWIVVSAIILTVMLIMGTAGASFGALKYCGPIDCWKEESRGIFAAVYMFLSLISALAAHSYVEETHGKVTLPRPNRDIDIA